MTSAVADKTKANDIFAKITKNNRLSNMLCQNTIETFFFQGESVLEQKVDQDVKYMHLFPQTFPKILNKKKKGNY